MAVPKSHAETYLMHNL